MENLQDLIGFLEHLKSLNKTKIEIDSVLKNLVEIKEKQLTICGVSNSLPFDTHWTMKTVNTTHHQGTKTCLWAIDVGSAYGEGFGTPNDALEWGKKLKGL